MGFLFVCFSLDGCWSHKVCHDFLKSILDTKVREGSCSYDKSQVCNFILQLVRSHQLKLFRLMSLVVFTINVVLKNIDWSTQKSLVTGFKSENISSEADNIILKC